MAKIDIEEVDMCDCAECQERRKGGVTQRAGKLVMQRCVAISVDVPAGTTQAEIDTSIERLGALLQSAVEVWEEDYAPGKVRH